MWAVWMTKLERGMGSHSHPSPQQHEAPGAVTRPGSVKVSLVSPGRGERFPQSREPGGSTRNGAGHREDVPTSPSLPRNRSKPPSKVPFLRRGLGAVPPSQGFFGEHLIKNSLLGGSGGYLGASSVLPPHSLFFSGSGVTPVTSLLSLNCSRVYQAAPSPLRSSGSSLIEMPNEVPRGLPQRRS